METSSIIKSAGFGLSALVALGVLLNSMEQVDTGHRGVRVTFGQVDETSGSMPEGLYFFNPFTTKIKEMDVRSIRWADKANTYTKDVQQADIQFVVTYRLEASQAHTMYKTVGVDWGNVLVGQAVIGPLKQVIGRYDAVDLIANRSKATTEVLAAVQAVLKPQHVIVDTVELTNVQYQKQFEKAVEEKVVAVQKATEEVNRTVQVQEQAKQQIISAQATAESMRIRANALASNPKLVEYEAVQKWDGKLPQYNLGGATPFINVPTGK